MTCKVCKEVAVVALPSHHAAFCASCYLNFFARQVERGIRRQKLFSREDRILVALSGGKDSLSLARELSRQAYNITGLYIDLGIPGSSDTAGKTVGAFCGLHGIPLLIVEAAREDLAIPPIKERLRRPICSVCGRIKRRFFNRAALEGGYDVLATGHNLDDEVARLSSNVLRWDGAYLAHQSPLLEDENGFVRKVKPLWRLSGFETAAYAFLTGIEHHRAPCPYSKGASFSVHKRLWRELEKAMPGRKLAFYRGFLERGRPAFAEREGKADVLLAPCVRCGSPTSAGVCGTCRIKEALHARA
jgi:uncharacterized protein (TIGR00269 family)